MNQSAKATWPANHPSQHSRQQMATSRSVTTVRLHWYTPEMSGQADINRAVRTVAVLKGTMSVPLAEAVTTGHHLSGNRPSWTLFTLPLSVGLLVAAVVTQGVRQPYVGSWALMPEWDSLGPRCGCPGARDGRRFAPTCLPTRRPPRSSLTGSPQLGEPTAGRS